jgi:hypothetical protein
MSIWDKFPNVSDEELRALVASTTRVILDSDEARPSMPADFLQISNLSASREMAALLPGIEPNQVSAIQELLLEEESSRKIALSVLEEVRKYPDLARRVSDEYEERTKKMVGPELVLLTGALVILAMKIKEIRWSKDGGGITFHDSGNAVKGFVLNLLKTIGA